MKKIWLDTDIGSDIDDAICLAYLLKQSTGPNPACKLLGISTVTGQAEKRAMLASSLCRAAGLSSVPIYPGCERTLIGRLMQPDVQQAEVLERFDHEKVFPKNQHIQRMIDAIRSQPGEVTLLVVGPLTNIALLFIADPEIPYLLKELVLMGGVFSWLWPGVGPCEFNARNDPYATAVVYEAPVKDHRTVGLDATVQVKLSATEIRKRFNHPLLRMVLEMAEIWFKTVDTIQFNDPLAAASLFSDRLCGFERGQVEVELASSRVRGMTHWKQQDDGPHQVAFRTWPDRYFKHFFNCFEEKGIINNISI